MLLFQQSCVIALVQQSIAPMGRGPKTKNAGFRMGKTPWECKWKCSQKQRGAIKTRGVRPSTIQKRKAKTQSQSQEKRCSPEPKNAVWETLQGGKGSAVKNRSVQPKKKETAVSHNRCGPKPNNAGLPCASVGQGRKGRHFGTEVGMRVEKNCGPQYRAARSQECLAVVQREVRSKRESVPCRENCDQKKTVQSKNLVLLLLLLPMVLMLLLLLLLLVSCYCHSCWCCCCRDCCYRCWFQNCC
jgi:hypothetical protein